MSSYCAQRQQVARILMYHGVCRSQAAEFEEEVDYLKKHFTIVSLHALVNGLTSNETNGRDQVVLTFDDGLKNNFTVVYPIICRLKVPVTFFLCPGLIESGNWIWTYETRTRLASLSDSERNEFAVRRGIGGGGIDKIVKWMKTLGTHDRQKMDAALRAATSAFQPSAKDREAYDLMNWKEACAMDPAMVTIGSHTNTHPILPTLTPEEATVELETSRMILEGKTGRTVDLFCYPDGANSPMVVDLVQKHYAAAVSTISDFVRSPADLCRLPRIPAGAPPAQTAWRMHRPNA
jgi:peptidoglycan/xylan/chitin deacetylase (PgdA/CDA1 family)